MLVIKKKLLYIMFIKPKQDHIQIKTAKYCLLNKQEIQNTACLINKEYKILLA